MTRHIAADETLPPPRWPDATRNKAALLPPTVLCDDYFDGSLCGYNPILNGDKPAPPQISLCEMFADSRSSKSLMIPVSGRPNRGGEPPIYSGSGAAIKRLSLFEEHGVVETQYWFSLCGASLDTAPQQFVIGLDIQWPFDTSRAFPSLYWRRFQGSTPVRVDDWQIVNDNRERVNIPDAGSPTGKPPVIGDNENKGGQFFASLALDLDGTASADGKPGAYAWARIGPRTYDLAGLGGGRGKESPQVTSAVGAGSFALGLNTLIGISSQTVNQEPGPSMLFVSRARVLHYARPES